MATGAQINKSKQSAPRAVPPRRTGPRGEVILYPNWCKGCHICVEFCPTGTLAMNEAGDHPVVIHPEKCTACHFCDTHCPDMAILVRKIE